MRILFRNEIEGATVTTVNGSLNYPGASIYHPFLRKKFKSLLISDALTIDLATAKNMNCFFMGFHNVASGTASFFDGSLSPVGSPIDLTAAADIFVSYFSTISVKRIVIDVSASASQVFIGGVGAGVYRQMPDEAGITAGFPFDVADSTTIAQSVGGQISRNRGPSLRLREWTWPNLDQTTALDVDTDLLTLGIGKPVWIDVFEGNRGLEAPMYGAIMDSRKLTNPAVNRFDLTLKVQEAR